MNKIRLQVPSEAGDTVEGLEQVAQTDENTETDNTSDINQPEGGEEMAGIDNADEAAQDGPAQDTSGRPGIDSVLSRVEEALGPEYAEVVRGLQTNMVQQGQLEAKRRELEDHIRRVEKLEEDFYEEREEASEPEEDLLSDVDPDQLARLNAWRDQQGLMTREEYDSERASEESDYVADEAIRQGIKEFGEDFGTINNGTFTLNPEQKSLMQPIFDRLRDPETGKVPEGLTYYDLYLRANYNKIVKAKADAAVYAEKKRTSNANSQRATRVKAGAVAPRPAGGLTESPLYDSEASKGKPMRSRISDVISAAKEKVLSGAS